MNSINRFVADGSIQTVANAENASTHLISTSMRASMISTRPPVSGAVRPRAGLTSAENLKGDVIVHHDSPRPLGEQIIQPAAPISAIAGKLPAPIWKLIARAPYAIGCTRLLHCGGNQLTAPGQTAEGKQRQGHRRGKNQGRRIESFHQGGRLNRRSFP